MAAAGAASASVRSPLPCASAACSCLPLYPCAAGAAPLLEGDRINDESS
eukprot:gene10093-1823_t